MPNVKFLEASAIEGISLRPDDLQSPAYKSLLTAFRENARHPLSLPGYASYTSLVWTSASIQAQHEIIGTNEATQQQVDANAGKFVKRVKELMEEKMRADSNVKSTYIAV